MSSLRTLRPYGALVAAAALGGAAAVGAVAVLGGLDGGTTVVTQTTPSATSGSSAAPRSSWSVHEIYERAAPGVVQINSLTATPDSFSGSGQQRALGSGFVVDKAGHIVTNYHVVRGADEIRVSFSNRDVVGAELVGTDPSTDLAVLRVDASARALRPLQLGDSDQVEVGDSVVAIGNPFGLDRTVTAGIVSALQRAITAPNQFTIDHVIQTDAPINQGNSGGPLLNAQGQVIGVNTQIETGGVSVGNVGIGFAVPSDTVKDVLAQILRTGRAEHAYLGVGGRPVNPELAEAYNLATDSGFLVQEVRPGSGAAKAGLRDGETEVVVAGETYVLGGDIVVAVDGQKIDSVEDLRDAVAAHKPGDELEIEIYRDATKTSVTVTLGRQPASPQG
jgi:putative serine protease PepD